MNLHELLETTITGLGYELVLIEQSARGRMIRVFIDAPEKEGGIDIDDCTRVSNQLTRVLMVEEFDYDRLEVSSPGLDRPLVKASDYERFAGQEAHVKVRVPVNNRRNFQGVLRGLEGDSVRMTTETGEVLLPLANIDKARLVPNFD